MNQPFASTLESFSLQTTYGLWTHRFATEVGSRYGDENDESKPNKRS